MAGTHYHVRMRMGADSGGHHIERYACPRSVMSFVWKPVAETADRRSL
jgi:hypothetical protein